MCTVSHGQKPHPFATTDAKNNVPSALSHKSFERQAGKLSTACRQEAKELNIDP
jgi:hypothetical protein